MIRTPEWKLLYLYFQPYFVQDILRQPVKTSPQAKKLPKVRRWKGGPSICVQIQGELFQPVQTVGQEDRFNQQLVNIEEELLQV